MYIYRATVGAQCIPVGVKPLAATTTINVEDSTSLCVYAHQLMKHWNVSFSNNAPLQDILGPRKCACVALVCTCVCSFCSDFILARMMTDP